jgi:protein-S-isoprenylcysteine O-methyltransferase Ste14
MALDVYGTTKTNNRAGVFLVAVQVLLILAAFSMLGFGLLPKTTVDKALLGAATIAILSFNLLTFGRFFLTLFVFLKRRSSADELIAVPIAFGVYYVGFLYLLYLGGTPSVTGITLGSALFLCGGLLNTLSEYQRHKWKRSPGNAGRLCRTGIYSLTRHPNYFGDVLWVLGYALVTGNDWSLLIPGLLLIFFWKGNIPLQEKHLLEKYGDQMSDYIKNTKSLIPFIL